MKMLYIYNWYVHSRAKFSNLFWGSIANKINYTIINNIIDNAIKYSGKNSKINITTSIIENKNNKELVLVKIKDNGIGIEEKHLPKIKDRFYRVDKVRSKSSNSSGLGLSIVKSLLEKNKGKFDIFSIFGKGTEVCLYFNKFIK